MKPTKSHGGNRKGAGRKPSPLPSFSKRLRASPDERKEFSEMLTGNAEKDFIILLNLLRSCHDTISVGRPHLSSNGGTVHLEPKRPAK